MLTIAGGIILGIVGLVAVFVACVFIFDFMNTLWHPRRKRNTPFAPKASPYTQEDVERFT